MRCGASRRCRPRVYRRSVDEDAQQRQLNIHIDPDVMAGVYSNFANISFSDYEFTLTFARIDHEVEEGDVPGVVVARVNMSNRFMRELLDAMEAVSVLPVRPFQSDRGIDDVPPDRRRDVRVSQASVIAIRWITVGWVSS